MYNKHLILHHIKHVYRQIPANLLSFPLGSQPKQDQICKSQSAEQNLKAEVFLYTTALAS